MPPKIRGSRLEQMRRDNEAARIKQQEAEKAKLLNGLVAKMQTLISEISLCKSKIESDEKIDELCHVEATLANIRDGIPKKEAYSFIKQKYNQFMAISSRDKVAGVEYAKGLVAPAREDLAGTNPDAVKAIDTLIGAMKKASVAPSSHEVAVVLGGTDVLLTEAGAPE
jgi:hypothetical protein